MPLAVKVLASVYLGAQRVPTRYSCCIIFASAITRERCFDIFSLDSAPQATSAEIQGDTLVITWEGEKDHVTHMPLDWLIAYKHGKKGNPILNPYF